MSDESHRLKKMSDGYDQRLFLQIYKETSSLRRKLAYDIDPRKFGVDYKEVLSWFDVKFIFVFHKYQDNDKLKGYIINALRTFKYHIIKNSYLPKNMLHQTVDITEIYDLQEPSEEGGTFFENRNSLLEMGKNYLKSILSEDAFFLFELELNPPPYILLRLINPEQKKIPKPSAELIAEYLGIKENDKEAVEYIKKLRKEIKDGIEEAHEHFLKMDLQV
jgi:hypothetical protein